MYVNINFDDETKDVQIHDSDVWGLDYTLALIIYPALLHLKEKKQGAPDVDNEDVPEHLRSKDHYKEEDGVVLPDDNWHKRWDYVLDEMIWAFRNIIEDEEIPDRYFSDEPVEAGSHIPENILGLGGKGFWVDTVREKRDWERTDEGLRLFGKYFRGLWS